MDSINILQVLDRMDKFRREHQNAAEAPSDYCMRFMEAILAEAAGYKSRNDWTDALKADQESAYSQDIQKQTAYLTF